MKSFKMGRYRSSPFQFHLQSPSVMKNWFCVEVKKQPWLQFGNGFQTKLSGYIYNLHTGITTFCFEQYESHSKSLYWMMHNGSPYTRNRSSYILLFHSKNCTFFYQSRQEHATKQPLCNECQWLMHKHELQEGKWVEWVLCKLENTVS